MSSVLLGAVPTKPRRTKKVSMSYMVRKIGKTVVAKHGFNIWGKARKRPVCPTNRRKAAKHNS